MYLLFSNVYDWTSNNISSLIGNSSYGCLNTAILYILLDKTFLLIYCKDESFDVPSSPGLGVLPYCLYSDYSVYTGFRGISNHCLFDRQVPLWLFIF